RPYSRRAPFTLYEPHFQVWHRSAKAKISRSARARKENRSVVPHRTWSRLRRRWYANYRYTQRKPLGPQRRENLHHERPLRRRLRRNGRHRYIQILARHQRFHRGKGNSWLQTGQKREQAWHARQRHFRSDFL